MTSRHRMQTIFDLFNSNDTNETDKSVQLAHRVIHGAFYLFSGDKSLSMWPQIPQTLTSSLGGKRETKRRKCLSSVANRHWNEELKHRNIANRMPRKERFIHLFRVFRMSIVRGPTVKHSRLDSVKFSFIASVYTRQYVRKSSSSSTCSAVAPDTTNRLKKTKQNRQQHSISFVVRVPPTPTPNIAAAAKRKLTD